MSHLIQIRDQIRAIQTTKKITHAIRLVSMSLYSKLEKKNTPLQKYTQQLGYHYALINANIDIQNSVLNPKKTRNSQSLIIIIATSRGLCGNLNANLIRFLQNDLNTHNNANAQYIIIGLQAVKALKNYNLTPIIHSYSEFNSNNYLSIADDLMDKISRPKNAYSSITVYHNEIKSFFIQQPCKFELIPLISPSLQETGAEKKIAASLLWEQEQQEIVSKIGFQYLRSIVIKTLFQALLAEHAARFLAMDSSTNNAEKFLERLILDYNKTRQMLITQEVAELTALETSR